MADRDAEHVTCSICNDTGEYFEDGAMEPSPCDCMHPTPPLRFIGQGDVEATQARLRDFLSYGTRFTPLPTFNDCLDRYTFLYHTLATGRPG